MISISRNFWWSSILLLYQESYEIFHINLCISTYLYLKPFVGFISTTTPFVQVVLPRANTKTIFTHEARVTHLGPLSVVTWLAVGEQCSVDTILRCYAIPGAPIRQPGQTLRASGALLCWGSLRQGPALASSWYSCKYFVINAFIENVTYFTLTNLVMAGQIRFTQMLC